MSHRLNAVNKMLDALGEMQVSSLENISGNVDLSLALYTLNSQSDIVQEKGWYFNTEVRLLSPDDAGEIVLPQNIIRVDSTGSDYYRDIIEREGKLYDKEMNSFNFDRSVECEIVLNLDFEILPAAARRYIELCAEQTFIVHRIGDSPLLSQINQSLVEAKTNLDQADSASVDYNILERNSELSRRRRI